MICRHSSMAQCIRSNMFARTGSVPPLNPTFNSIEDQAKYEEAKALYEDVLAASSRNFGRDHPSSLRARWWLASVLAKQGKHKDATQMAREVLEDNRILYGDEDRQTLRALGNLADDEIAKNIYGIEEKNV